MNKMETKVYIMKRKNLNPTKVSPSSIHRMEGGKAALEKANLHMGTTAEHEANLTIHFLFLFYFLVLSSSSSSFFIYILYYL